MVPPVLVGSVRNALTSQGLDPTVINDDGTINPAGLVSSAFDTITIRSALHNDPIVIQLRGPADPQTQALLDQIRPEVTLQGRAGRYVIAPAGSPASTIDFTGSLTTLGLGLGAAVLGVALLGRAFLR